MDYTLFSKRQQRLLDIFFEMMTPEQRVSCSFLMTHCEIERSRAEIAKAHPEFSTVEVKLEWARIAYGEELAKGLRADLERRARLGEYPAGYFEIKT